jgi:hypothetical protein
VFELFPVPEPAAFVLGLLSLGGLLLARMTSRTDAFDREVIRRTATCREVRAALSIVVIGATALLLTEQGDGPLSVHPQFWHAGQAEARQLSILHFRRRTEEP